MLKFQTYDDAVYAHTDFVKFLREMGPEMMNAWLTDRDNKYGQQAAVPSWHAWQHALPDALDTEILWMSVEMMDLVQTAMKDFDPTEAVTVDDIFLPTGFMVLPHAFMSKDINDKTLAWRILQWKLLDPMVVIVNDNQDDMGYTYDLSHDGDPEPGVRFMQMSWTYDDDDWSAEYPELLDRLRENGDNWGIAHATALPLRFMNSKREVSGEGDRKADWLLFWRVAQKLMAETIVTKEHRVAGRPARRDAKRYLMPPPLLRVIELRRPRQDRDGEEREQSTREYTHRWIVRGHWRNQPWGPGLKYRRQRYIGAYVKGPDDLDLIVKQRVWNWDR